MSICKATNHLAGIRPDPKSRLECNPRIPLMAPIDSRELNLTDVSETDVTPLVPREELNAWKRGFTPQAEIWNGRFAMLGVTLVLATVLILNWERLGF